MGLFDFGDRLRPWCGTELNLKDNYDDEAKTFRCHNCKFRIEPIACRYIVIKSTSSYRGSSLLLLIVWTSCLALLQWTVNLCI